MADVTAPPSSRGLGVSSRKPSSRTTHSRSGQISWSLEAAQRDKYKNIIHFALPPQLGSVQLKIQTHDRLKIALFYDKTKLNSVKSNSVSIITLPSFMLNNEISVSQLRQNHEKNI